MKINRWIIRLCALISFLSLLSGQSKFPEYLFWVSIGMLIVWCHTEWSDYKEK